MVGLLRAAGRSTGEVLVVGQVLSRAILFGSYALYEDIMRDVDPEQFQTGDLADIEVAVKINEDRVGGTAAFAGGLVFVANAWTLKKLVLRSRLDFIQSVGNKLISSIDALIEGRKIPAQKGRIATWKGGMTALRGEALALRAAVDAGEDIGSIGIKLISLKQRIDDANLFFDEVMDNFKMLQFANTVGQTGSLQGVESATLSLDDAQRLKKIEASNTIFGRVQKVKVGDKTKVISTTSKFRPFANPEVAELARLFVPSEVSDDIFDLAKILKDLDLSFAKMRDELYNVKVGIDEAGRVVQRLSVVVDSPAKERTLRTIVGMPVEAAIQATARVGDDIKSIQDIKRVFGRRIKVASNMADGLVARLLGGVGYGVTYAAVRSTGVVGVKKQTAKNISQKVAQGIKGFVRVANKFFFIDTIIWALTGAIDLAFIDDDAEYENAMLQYLADNWGFSISGALTDMAIDALIPQKAQDVALQNLRATLIATVVNSPNLTSMVNTLIEFYQLEFDVTVFPADFVISREQAALAIKDTLTIKPEDILGFALVACVAKVVFKGWIAPAFRAFTASTGA